ncbi:hypothetical protein Taro_048118 [Colocasia esculenta]|uniref:Homeobox-leucine zipper protein n=1 Tax=Colocasia esculenta TaxID=4460 RepID=A0A843X4T6_COLES|nr:hypothetical protein [Colocasia esculenta]
MESDELSGDSYGCGDDLVLPGSSRKGNLDGAGENGGADGKRKRRFSDEQIKSLECTFEAQTKLEPRKKLQLARELGLQPRQVAIWFQNKRARWKSKQLERDYGALRAEYDTLLSSFESLEKEKQTLAKQMLEELLKKPSGVSSGSDGGDSDQSDAKGEEETKPSLASLARSDLTLNTVCSTKEESILHEEKLRVIPDLPAAARTTDHVIHGPLCFDAGSFSDQSCGSSSDWWEFWPLNE